MHRGWHELHALDTGLTDAVQSSLRMELYNEGHAVSRK